MSPMSPWGDILTEQLGNDISGLPRIGWRTSCAGGEGGRIGIKAAEVEEDRHSEALAVSEPSSEDFDFLNLRIHALGAGVGDPMAEERVDVRPVTPQHA